MDTRTQLSEIRQQRGISAAQLSRLVGVSRQTVYAIEAGDYVPNTTLALQLAKVLEVRVEELFSLEPEPPTPSKPVSADLIDDAAARKGQPVQICRVGKRLAAVSATPQTVLLPMADGIVVEGSKSKSQVLVQLFPGEWEQGKRVLVAGCDPGISLLAQHLARFDDVDMVVAQSSSQQ